MDALFFASFLFSANFHFRWFSTVANLPEIRGTASSFSDRRERQVARAPLAVRAHELTPRPASGAPGQRSEVLRQAVFANGVPAASNIMAHDYLQGTSSATELLMESESLRSLFRVRRDVKKMFVLAAAILVVLVIAISIGAASRPRAAGQQGGATENAIMQRLAAANINFALGNSSALLAGAAQKADSLRHGGNKTRRHEDDYRELDKI